MIRTIAQVCVTLAACLVTILSMDPLAHAQEVSSESNVSSDEPAQSQATSEDLISSPKVHLNKLANTDPTGRYWVQNTWDLSLDLIFGPVFERVDSMPPWTFGGRLRGGLLLIREPLFVTAGLTAQFDTWQAPAFGAEAEVSHLVTGLWMHVGAFADIEASAGATFGFGWSSFGVETQVRVDSGGDAIWTLLAKVRVPIRLFFFVD